MPTHQFLLWKSVIWSSHNLGLEVQSGYLIHRDWPFHALDIDIWELNFLCSQTHLLNISQLLEERHHLRIEDNDEESSLGDLMDHLTILCLNLQIYHFIPCSDNFCILSIFQVLFRPTNHSHFQLLPSVQANSKDLQIFWEVAY